MRGFCRFLGEIRGGFSPRRRFEKGEKAGLDRENVTDVDICNLSPIFFVFFFRNSPPEVSDLTFASNNFKFKINFAFEWGNRIMN